MTQGFFTAIPPPFNHQTKSTKRQLEDDRIFDTSDPGTGKTRAALDAFNHRVKLGTSKKCLVLAPKSILQPAWGNDIKKFTPELTYSIATALNRAKAFDKEANIYITNHDAVKWILEHKEVLKGFDTIIIDELTAYKHHTSQRSKAVRKLVKLFKYRVGLTGTPNPNSITDIHHQLLLIDDGERLGTSFWKFRASVCEPVQVGPGKEMLQWVDKVGAEEAVADLIEDITIRNKFDECIDIPPHSVSTIEFDLSEKHRLSYEELRLTSILELQSTTITAVHAGTVANKLLQLTSGSVYDNDKISRIIDTERYEIIIELVKQRKQSLVAFNWRHQREELVKLAKKAKIKYAVIDGEASDKERIEAVNEFQAGRLQVIFAHPQSAGHGLTLTKGTATIWASPTYNAEHFEQLNKRIHRAGQTQKTETILIAARNTIDTEVYKKLNGKLEKMTNLLGLLKDQQE